MEPVTDLECDGQVSDVGWIECAPEYACSHYRSHVVGRESRAGLADPLHRRRPTRNPHVTNVI